MPPAVRRHCPASSVRRPAVVSSLRKMLGILDLFTASRPVLTIEEIVVGLGYSRPTGYRHIAELCRAGLLSRRSAGDVALGPRVVELDYVMRQGDPILEPSQAVARELRDRCGCDTLLLTLVGDRVVTTHHERGSDPLTISYSRGRPVPMFRGAGSRAILAFLPLARQRKLFAVHAEEIAAAGLGRDWDAFRAALQAMRRAGTTTSIGELDQPNIGVGAPILDGGGKPVGSLVLVLSRPRYAIADKTLLAQLVTEAAGRIGASMRPLATPAAEAAAVAAPPARPSSAARKPRRSGKQPPARQQRRQKDKRREGTIG